MAQKKLPLRMCVGCREMKEKRELIRVVLPPGDEITPERIAGIGIDFRGKQNGRGAYLCNNAVCLAKAKKTHALERAFGIKSAIPDGIYEKLTEQICGGDAH